MEYSDFANMFFLEFALAFFKHIGINDHAIKLINKQQPLHGPVYNLELVELETLKTYIKTNLANGFIKLSKFLVKTPIFFAKNQIKASNFVLIIED